MKDNSKSARHVSPCRTQLQFLQKCSLLQQINFNMLKNHQATCFTEEASPPPILSKQIKLFQCFRVPLVLTLSFCTFLVQLILLGFEYSEEKMSQIPFFSFVTGAILLLCLSTIILWKVVCEEKKNFGRKQRKSESPSSQKNKIEEKQEVIHAKQLLNALKIETLQQNQCKSNQSGNICGINKKKNQYSKQPPQIKSHPYLQIDSPHENSKKICFFRSWSILAIFQGAFDVVLTIYVYGEYENFVFCLEPNIIIIVSIIVLALLKLFFNLKLWCDEYRQCSIAKVTPTVKTQQVLKSQITKKKLAVIMPHSETQESQNRIGGNIHNHITVKKRLTPTPINTQKPLTQNIEQIQSPKPTKQRESPHPKEKPFKFEQLKQPCSVGKGREEEKKKVCINDDNNRYYFYETSLDAHSDNAPDCKKSVVLSSRSTKKKMFSLLGEAVIEKSLYFRVKKQTNKEKTIMIKSKRMEDSSISGESVTNEKLA